jgi:hypothetical protein
MAAVLTVLFVCITPGVFVQSPVVAIPLADLRPVLQELKTDVPVELAGGDVDSTERAWSRWRSKHAAAIAVRLAQGEEDSIVNFLLFGTSFTRQPRALNDSSKLGGRDRGAAIVRARLDDLVAAIGLPGANERLAFVRDVVRRHGVDPDAPGDTRRYIVDLMRRVFGELEEYVREINAAKSVAEADAERTARATLFRTRGLSTDTSIRADYAVDAALQSIRAQGTLSPHAIGRVAIVGPGLDFTDKAEGFDFYPQQTTQPFSVLESLRRTDLAREPFSAVHVTTFDINPRVNTHLERARQRAQTGQSYVIVLPRAPDVRWEPGLLQFWRSFGAEIGGPARAPRAPAGTALEVRAVAARPDVVRAIEPHPLDVVVERTSDERFDLVVVTNVLVYYPRFEQSLALANIAAMLTPGGLLVTNTAVVELTAIPLRRLGALTIRFSDAPDDSDQIRWYRREER